MKMSREQFLEKFETDEKWHSFKLTAVGCMMRHERNKQDRNENELDTILDYTKKGGVL